MNNILLNFLFTGNDLPVCPIFPYRFLLPLNSSITFDSMWTYNEGRERILYNQVLFSVWAASPYRILSNEDNI